MKDIIGLIGFAGSGKDTVGNILRDYFGYEKYSMAGPLKDIISILFSWDRDLLEGATKESREWRESPDEWWTKKLNWEERFGCKFTPRICMQYIGTDVLRNHFDINLWVNILEKNLSNKKKIVVTDCRFKNEIDTILNNSGDIIRVRRGKDPEWFERAKQNISDYHNNPDMNNSFLWMDILNIHHSEVDWLDTNPSFILENNGTKEDILKYFR